MNAGTGGSQVRYRSCLTNSKRFAIKGKRERRELRGWRSNMAGILILHHHCKTFLSFSSYPMTRLNVLLPFIFSLFFLSPFFFSFFLSFRSALVVVVVVMMVVVLLCALANVCVCVADCTLDDDDPLPLPRVTIEQHRRLDRFPVCTKLSPTPVNSRQISLHLLLCIHLFYIVFSLCQTALPPSTDRLMTTHLMINTPLSKRCHLRLTPDLFHFDFSEFFESMGVSQLRLLS